MSSTTGRGYAFPQLGDTVNVPGDIQGLAESIDADVQTIADEQLFIGCRLTQATAQGSGWTTGVYKSLTFDAEDFDYGPGGSTDPLHDTSVNNSRINIGKKLGVWRIDGMFTAGQNSSISNHRVHLTQNGTAVPGAMFSIGVATSQFVCIPLPSTLVIATLSTDYVELQGFLAGSGSLVSAVSSEARSSFEARYQGPAPA